MKIDPADVKEAGQVIVLMVIAGSVIYILVIPTVQQEMAWGTSGVGYLAAIGAIGLLFGAYLMGIFGHHFDLKILMLVCFVLVGGSLFLFPFLRIFLLAKSFCRLEKLLLLSQDYALFAIPYLFGLRKYNT